MSFGCGLNIKIIKIKFGEFQSKIKSETNYMNATSLHQILFKKKKKGLEKLRFYCLLTIFN